MKVLYAMIYAPEKGGSGAPIYINHLMNIMAEHDETPGIIYSAHHSYISASNLRYDIFPLFFDRPPIFDNQPKLPHSIAFKDMSEKQIAENIDIFYEGFKRVIAKYKYELIHVQHGMFIGYVASLVRKKLGTPYVITLHAMELNFLHEFPEPIMAMAAMVNADRIIALTLAQKQRLVVEYTKIRILELEMQQTGCSLEKAQEKYRELVGKGEIRKENITVCPLGIDTQVFDIKKNADTPHDIVTLHIKPKEDIVMFAGRLIDMKGIKNLLVAEPFYNKKNIVHTIILGGGELEDYVTKIATERHNVHYLGFKEQDEMPAYYRFLADRQGVFSVPSSSEGMSIAYLESMACGARIVGCCKKDMGDLPFMRPPYMTFVPFGDIHALSLAITTYLADKDFSLKEVRRRMEVFNLHNMFTYTYRVYCEVYRDYMKRLCM